MKKRIMKIVSCGAILMILLFIYGRTPVAGANDEHDLISIDPTGEGDGYTGVLYDNTSGLPTSEANDIVQTAEGFMWIGSYGGLIRYDGNTFYRVDSTKGIASVVCLYVDSSNRLWVGTNDSGLAVMDNGEIVNMFGKTDGLGSLSVRAITEDHNHNIYVGTTHGLAMIDAGYKLTVIDDSRIDDESIRDIKIAPNGVIYGVTSIGSIFTIENGKVTSFYTCDDMGIEDVYSFIPDDKAEGYIYIGTRGSVVYRGKLENGFTQTSKIDVAPLSYINSLNKFGNQIWVCADNGIAMIENNQVYYVNNVAMDSSVEKVVKDYQGNLWFASSKQGVMKIVENMFLDIFSKYKLSSTVVNSTLCYDGNLFIGSKNDGLMIVNNKGLVENYPLKSATYAGGTRMEATDLFDILGHSRIRSMILDSKDRIWISTFNDNALIRYDHGDVVCFNADMGLPSNRVRVVNENSDGTFSVVCTGGIAVIDGDKVKKVYDDTKGIGNTEFLTVTEGFNKEKIIGTDGDGMYIISADDKVTHIGIEEGLSSEVVMRVKRSINSDIYWLVTSNSIAYMEKDYKVHTIKKFPYSNNFDIIENSKGDAWILSSNGIYEIEAKKLIDNGDIDPVFYSFSNGLPCIATANSYSGLTSDGNLYIAGTTGVAKVNIENTKSEVSDVKMYVPYIEVDGKRIYPDEDGKFVVSYKAKKIDIYGYVFTYSLMNPKVTYYLDGFDRNKTTVDRSDFNVVSYTNLKGGNYKFVMKLKDIYGNESSELSVVIVKKKAFYETYWFRILMVLLAVGLLALFVKLYIDKKTRALLKKEKENKLLVREIVEAFAKTIDMKDKYTNGHSSRVAEYTAMLTRELGYDEDTVEKYYNIALLHDIGKIGVPGDVLNKNGKLTDEEYGIIKSHSSLGYNVLKDISIMPELATGAGAHHERPDGKGYPNGLVGDKIPRVAQIIAVADTFDAMYSNRPYRKRMNFEKVVSIIKEVSGTQLTADVVDAFLRLVDKGEFRAEDDNGGGTMDDIDNIHKSFEAKEAKEAKESEAKGKESEA